MSLELELGCLLLAGAGVAALFRRKAGQEARRASPAARLAVPKSSSVSGGSSGGESRMVVTLHKWDRDFKLGFKVGVAGQEQQALVIQSIDHGGLLDAWNTRVRAPDRVVPGSQILSVKGLGGCACDVEAMVAELSRPDQEALELHIARRDSEVDPETVLSAQTAFPELPAQLPRMDGTWDWIRKGNDPHQRAIRVDSSRCLREAFAKGGYCISAQGKTTSSLVNFSCIPKMLAGTRLLSIEQGLPELPQEPKPARALPLLEYGQGVTPIAKAATMVLEGFKPAAVSAASAYHAGGGFTSGGRHALEEAFCSQSTLYPSLEKAQVLWKAGVAEGKWRGTDLEHAQYIPTDGCILSPHVEIFRGNTDQGYLAHRRTVPISAVVSVAMYNKNPRVRDSPLDAPGTDEEYEQGVRRKFTAMIHGAALAGADAIIIPDVGCGVFQNDPHVCGRVCGEVLHNYASRFRRCVFTGNLSFFQAAHAAISKASADRAPPMATAVLQRAFSTPVDSKAHLYIGKCAVCGRGLGGVPFDNLAILLDPSLKSTKMRFILAGCIDGARSRFPQYETMILPDITRDAKSFFRALDLNGNGFIERQELKCIFALLWEGDLETDHEAMGKGFERDFDAMFKAWDADRSGNVDVEEAMATPSASLASRSGAAGASAGAVQENCDPAALERAETIGLCVESMGESSCIEWFQQRALERQRRASGDRNR